jgi:site-specific DNA recombinase
MKAAIYRRYSTDQQNESTLQDQLRICQERAEAEGWEIVEVYTDAAISGGGTANRPGYLAMMAAAEAHQFEILLCMDLTRLSRHQGDLPKIVETLTYYGVRTIAPQDGFDSEREDAELSVGLHGIIGHQYRILISRKTRAALTTRAKDGKPTGGRAYGYNTDGTINGEQAKWVRQMFTWYVENWSPKSIAAELNAQGVPAPGASYARKVRRGDGKWMASAVAGDWTRGQGILANPRYRGEIIWNRVRGLKNPKTNATRTVVNPESEWTRRMDESLRIVSEELWNAVQTRHRQIQESLGQAVKEGLRRAHSGRGPKHLMSSILKCGACGSALVMSNSTSYQCGSFFAGGSAACSQSVRVRRDVAEDRLLGSVIADLLTDESIEEIKRLARAELAARHRAHAENDGVAQSQLAEVEKKVANCLHWLATDTLRGSKAMADQLAALEREKASLLAKLQGDKHTAALLTVIPRSAERIRGMILDFRRQAAKRTPRDIARVRAALRTLLKVRVEVENGLPVAVVEGDLRILLTPTAPFAKISVPGRGLEPPTRALRMRCSTN